MFKDNILYDNKSIDFHLLAKNCQYFDLDFPNIKTSRSKNFKHLRYPNATASFRKYIPNKKAPFNLEKRAARKHRAQYMNSNEEVAFGLRCVIIIICCDKEGKAEKFVSK